MFNFLVFLSFFGVLVVISFMFKYVIRTRVFFFRFFYLVLSLTSLMLYFWTHSWTFFYWLFEKVTQKGEFVIVLGDGQELLFLILEVSIFFSILFVIPFFILYIFMYFQSYSTKTENVVYIFLCNLGVYLYIITIWVFLQDLGFSIWEILNNVSSQTSKELLCWTLLDYQPQLESVFLFLRNEFFDFFFWVWGFFFCFYGVCLKILQVSKALSFVKNFFLYYCVLGSCFFFGGDSFVSDYGVFFLSILWSQLCIFMFYFFKHLVKKV